MRLLQKPRVWRALPQLVCFVVAWRETVNPRTPCEGRRAGYIGYVPESKDVVADAAVVVEAVAVYCDAGHVFGIIILLCLFLIFLSLSGILLLLVLILVFLVGAGVVEVVDTNTYAYSHIYLH